MIHFLSTKTHLTETKTKTREVTFIFLSHFRHDE